MQSSGRDLIERNVRFVWSSSVTKIESKQLEGGNVSIISEREILDLRRRVI